MILISADRKIAGKTMLCLQEKDGRFPSTVEVYRPENIELTCTRSGLFTDSTYNYWVKKVLSEAIPQDQKSLFLADSFAPHKNKENYVACETEDDLFEFRINPPSTTHFAQLYLFQSPIEKFVPSYCTHVEDRQPSPVSILA